MWRYAISRRGRRSRSSIAAPSSMPPTSGTRRISSRAPWSATRAVSARSCAPSRSTNALQQPRVPRLPPDQLDRLLVRTVALARPCLAGRELRLLRELERPLCGHDLRARRGQLPVRSRARTSDTLAALAAHGVRVVRSRGPRTFQVPGLRSLVALLRHEPALRQPVASNTVAPRA